MDQTQRERMAALSGENARSNRPSFSVPEIRFDGNTGEFRKITKVADSKETQETPIGKSVTVVVLKKRRALKAFKDDDSWFTTEFASPQSTITLFHSIAGNTQKLATGTPPEIRAKYPQLKTQEVLYVLHGGEIARITVRGGSSANYYDFQNKMRDEDKHSFEYDLSIGSEASERLMGKQKKKYFRMTFEALPLSVEADVVEAKMTFISNELAKIDAYEAQASGAPKNVAAVDEDGWVETEEKAAGDIPF